MQGFELLGKFLNDDNNKSDKEQQYNENKSGYNKNNKKDTGFLSSTHRLGGSLPTCPVAPTSITEFSGVNLF